MKRERIIWWVIAVALLVTFSCGQSDRQTDSLIIGVTGDTDSINPLLTRTLFGGELAKMLFLSLLQEQPDFVSFKPQLARSWEFSDDRKVVTFHLRTDVYWIDSMKVTAADVIFTFNKQKDPDIGWSGRNVKERITDVQAVDDSTVEFYFEEPYLEQIMDANEGVILPEHILTGLTAEQWQDCAFNQMPVGDGPYKLKNWIPNQYIELQKNDLYYDKPKPRITRLIFKIVPDNTQLLGQLETGEIQLMESVPPREARKIAEESNKLKIETFPFGQFIQVVWNLRNPLFADVKTRRALTMAIDRQALVDHLLVGYGKICKSPIHPILWAHDGSLTEIPFNPDGARELLGQSGWRDLNDDGILEKGDQKFEFSLLTNAGSGIREDAQVMIQEMLRKVGIKVNTLRLEWSVYVDRLMAREFDAVIIGMMSPSRVDLKPAWHSSMIGPNGFNLSCYNNARVDQLIEEATAMIDRETSRPLWNEIQRIIVEDQPVTFLWIPDRIIGMDKRIKGYRFSPTSTFFNIAEWSM